MNRDFQRVLKSRQPDVTSSSLDAAHVLDPRSNIGRLYPVVLCAWDTWRYSRLSTSCPLGALLLILLYVRSELYERRVLYRYVSTDAP